jgi:K+ transporter
MNGRKKDEKHTAAMTLGAMGVVFGDIGTNPFSLFANASRLFMSDRSIRHLCLAFFH